MKVKRVLVSFSLVVFLIVVSFSNLSNSAKAVGSGYWTNYAASIVNPVGNIYTITTPEQLAWVANQVNNGNSFAGYSISLGADIDLNAHYWVPIGTSYSYYFGGTFDGQNHVISNMCVSLPYNGLNLGGLFAAVRSATIQNLHLYNTSVIWTSSSSTTSVDVGSIAGFMYDGSLINCSANAAVVRSTYSYSASSSPSFYVGGLLGVSSTNILNCCTINSVVSASASAQVGGMLVGGLTGQITGGTVKNSFANSSLSGTGYGALVGGVSGYANATNIVISNCYSNSTVTASGTNAKIAGFLGANTTTSVTNCFWNSDCGASVGYTGTAVPLNLVSLTGAQITNSNTFTNGSNTNLYLYQHLNAGASSIAGACTWSCNNNLRNNISILDKQYFTISYNGNNNTGGTAPSAQCIFFGNPAYSISQNSGSLLRTGYVFSGWNTAADGSGTTYSANSAISISQGNLILYAIWVPDATTYSITYNGNGNTSGYLSMQVFYAYGNSATIFDGTQNLSKIGRTFAGWNTAADGSGTSYQVGNVLTLSSNLTLYAQWS